MLSERISALWLRWKALVRRRELDRDLDDELAFHLAMREQKLREQGVAEEAPYAARRQFGNVARSQGNQPRAGNSTYWRLSRRTFRYRRAPAAPSPGLTAVLRPFPGARNRRQYGHLQLDQCRDAQNAYHQAAQQLVLLDWATRSFAPGFVNLMRGNIEQDGFRHTRFTSFSYPVLEQFRALNTVLGLAHL